MIGYFAKHTERLGLLRPAPLGPVDRQRGRGGPGPADGPPAEGAGRGWCAGNLDGMAALIATVDTPEWDGLWTRPAA